MGSTYFLVTSQAPSAHCAYFTFIFPSVSGVSFSNDCWMIIWMLGRFRCFPPTLSPPTCLTLRLFPLSCFLPSAPRCLICASSSCCCTSADNTGGGSGRPGLPGNSLTDHMAAVTCCILSRSACSSLCALWGDTFSAGSSDVHRYNVKSREVGGTKICAILVLDCLRACLGAWFPEIHVGFLGCFGEGFDSSLTFQCSSVKKCCWNKILCDFTIFIPLAFLYLPHLPLSLLFLSSLHCWRCSTLCLRRDTSPSVTHQKRAFIRYPQVCRVACLCYLFPRVSAAVPTPPTARPLKCSFTAAAGSNRVTADREQLMWLVMSFWVKL